MAFLTTSLGFGGVRRGDSDGIRTEHSDCGAARIQPSNPGRSAVCHLVGTWGGLPGALIEPESAEDVDHFLRRFQGVVDCKVRFGLRNDDLARVITRATGQGESKLGLDASSPGVGRFGAGLGDCKTKRELLDLRDPPRLIDLVEFALRGFQAKLGKFQRRSRGLNMGLSHLDGSRARIPLRLVTVDPFDLDLDLDFAFPVAPTGVIRSGTITRVAISATLAVFEFQFREGTGLPFLIQERLESLHFLTQFLQFRIGTSLLTPFSSRSLALASFDPEFRLVLRDGRAGIAEDGNQASGEKNRNT